MAGYNCSSQHSFEQVAVNLMKHSEVRAIIDEHFRLSRMSAEECLIEISKLARGNSRDKVKALAMLSAHHGLLDGTYLSRPNGDLVEQKAEQIANQRIEEYAKEVEKEVEIYNAKAIANNERKDIQWKAICERYKHSPEAVEALELMFRVMKGQEEIEPYEEPPAPKPEPEIEIIVPEARRLNAAPIEKMLQAIEPDEILPPEPQPTLCRHGAEVGQCRTIEIGNDYCPHHYSLAPKRARSSFRFS